MNASLRAVAGLLVACSVLCVAGCGGGKKSKPMRLNRPPEMPPAAPARATVPI
jgi:hypothetical protein